MLVLKQTARLHLTTAPKTYASALAARHQHWGMLLGRWHWTRKTQIGQLFRSLILSCVSSIAGSDHPKEQHLMRKKGTVPLLVGRTEDVMREAMLRRPSGRNRTL